MLETSKTTFDTRMLVLNAKGINTPKTFRLVARDVADLFLIAEIRGEWTEDQQKRLKRYEAKQENLLLALEGKPHKTVAIVDGERYLSDEQMDKRVLAYRKELATVRAFQADYERHVKECDNATARILANIPVGQRNAFQDLLELMEITTNPPVMDESENLVEVEESIEA